MGDETYRFWEYKNGSPVRMKIRAGETLRHYQWRYTEEGWDSELDTWEIVGDELIRTTCYDGRGCDGRLCRNYINACKLDRLYSGNRIQWRWGKVNVCLPAWEIMDRWNYDEFAARMGY